MLAGDTHKFESRYLDSLIGAYPAMQVHTVNPRVWTLNHPLENRHPKPENQNPKPEARNPKLENRNPKPETLP